MIDSKGRIIHNAKLFYQKCINGKLKEEEIRFKEDGTTVLKLNAISLLVNFIDNAKMTGLYNGKGMKLAIDRVVGTVSYCLGFKQEGSYYLPSSCLLEDTRNIVDSPSQVLVIIAKSSVKKSYIKSRITGKSSKQNISRKRMIITIH